MAEYNLTNKAVEDLDKIWNYTFDRWSEKQADDYYDMLIASCQKLAQNTSLGRNYNGITENLFGLRTNRHIIFYRIIAEEEIEVERILYERMDLESTILE
ncbi:toxin ParE1/3/4 [Pricia antarctica]|uniref:Toxin n=1 Tax=Pricia antarctica TaxID=641691 RepID=A0A1G7DGW2_9FLAO|nr:type II toxin-antitoxin system RelE/ParE family toxin [Pricia antarctica]SDE50762.1 toxin ParE1/3/4 [Pricia antarctica]